MKGKKNWSGDFYGRLPLPPIERSGVFDLSYFMGITGFTGLKIRYFSDDDIKARYYFIGSASWVKIGSEPLER